MTFILTLGRRACLFLCSLVMVLPLVGIAAVEAQTWTKHTYAADGFEVEFSGKVEISPTGVSDEVRKRLFRATNYHQLGGDYEFLVAASLQRVDVNFEKGAADSWGAMKCATKVSDTPLRFRGGRAREIRGTNCEGQIRLDSRFFTVGRWFYQVIAVHPLNGSREVDARRFVESFRVIGKGKR